ncbi:MAG: immune inhibitor A [Chloroflexota bacterium]
MEKQTKKRAFWPWLVSCLLLGCCCGLLVLGAGFWLLEESGEWDPFVSELWEWQEATPWPAPAATRTAVSGGLSAPEITAVVPLVEREATPTTAPPPVSRLRQPPPDRIEQRPPAPRATVDLGRLYRLTFPPHDYYETAVRLGGHPLGPRQVGEASYRLGDRQTFFLEDVEVEAELLVIGQQAAFWVERGVNVDLAELREVSRRLDTTLYPRLVALFGQPGGGGLDENGRFAILHTRLGLGLELGYFTSVDLYPASLFETSNEQAMVYLNVDELEVGSELYYGTLVHEIQHLIQGNVDPNEKAWLDEGLSQLAELYLDFYTVDTLPYLEAPGISLNLWPTDEEEADAHYAASYLFAVYFWEQLGETAVQELARHPANGIASVWSVLQGFAPERPLPHFVADWAVANLLDDPDAGPVHYYENLLLTEYPATVHTASVLPEALTSSLPPFGVDYIALDVSGPIVISFAGDTAVALSSSPPPEGRCYWLAPPMNDTAASLAGTFDLTGLTQATLTFDTWFDLEPGWDFAYVTISTDGGESWSLLRPHYASAGEFGPGFTGYSGDIGDSLADTIPDTIGHGGWLSESIVLDAYVGQVVEIRFEVLTDYAILGRGFAVDNIAIPELGHFSGAELACSHDGQQGTQAAVEGWQGQGFAATGWQLPQKWALRLVTWGNEGRTPTVTPLLLDELNQGEWTVTLGNEGGVLVVTAVTPFTEAEANYWLSVIRDP